MKLIVYSQSDVGRIRDINEDSVAIVPPPDAERQERLGHLYLLADGMGGAEAGEIASSQAIETAAATYYEVEGTPNEALVQAIEAANHAVYQRAQRERRIGMGTTMVAAAIVGNKLYIAHVGDSRLYLLRGDRIAPLTRDHSLVGEQVAAGILTPDEASRHPHRNFISRAVGTATSVEVEISANSPLTLHEGDLVLICSDGLTEYVKPDRLLSLLQGKMPAEGAPLLIQAANAGGGADNISVILIRAGDAPEREAAAVTTQIEARGGAATQTIPAAIPAAAARASAPAAAPAPAPAPRRRSPLPALIALVALLSVGGFMLFRLYGDALLPPRAPEATVTAAGGILQGVASATPPSATGSPTGTTLITSTALPAVVSPAAGSPTVVAGTATVVRTVTPSATRPVATRAVTPSVVPSATPAAAAPSSTANASLSPPAGSPVARAITLVEPVDGAQSFSSPLTFGAVVENLVQGDIVQLRLKNGRRIVGRFEMSQEAGNRFVRSLDQPPRLADSSLLWQVAVIPVERTASGTVVSLSKEFTLSWLPPQPTAAP